MNTRACSLLLAVTALSASACVGQPLAEGDEVATSHAELFIGHYTWPRDANGITTTIPVCWRPVATELPDFASLRAQVRAAAENTWMRESGVNFTGWGPCTSGRGIYLSISDEQPRTDSSDMIFGSTTSIRFNFTFANWSPTCASNRAGCVYKIAAHEFGHALGFNHEQARGDTPSTCTQRDDFDWLATLNGGVSLGVWDGDSIMNYCNPVWNNDGRLSAGDIRGLQYQYGRKPRGSLVTTNGLCATSTSGYPWMQLGACAPTAGVFTSWFFSNNTNAGTPGFTGLSFPGSGSLTADTRNPAYPAADQFQTMTRASVSGSYVAVAPTYASVAQRWSMPDVTIRAIGGKAVEVGGFGTAPGTPVQIWDDWHGPNQSWTFHPTDGSIRGYGGQCIDVTAANTADGTPIQMYTCNGYNTQRWFLAPNGEIRSVLGGGAKCLTILNSNNTNGARLTLATCRGEQGQLFSLRGHVRTTDSGLCLASGGRTTAGFVRDGACASTDDQTWDYYW